MGKLICTVLRGLSSSNTTWLPDQLIENKARFIEQFERGDVQVREIDDIGTAVLSAAEIKAIASGNPRIRRKVELDAELLRLSSLRTSFYDTQSQRRSMRWNNQYKRKDLDLRLTQFSTLHMLLAPTEDQDFRAVIVGSFGQANAVTYTKRDGAGEALLGLLDQALAQATAAFREAEEAERQRRRTEFGQRAGAAITEFDAYWLEPQKVDHIVGQYRGLTIRIKASASHREQWVGSYLTFPFDDQEVAIPNYTVKARTPSGVMSSIDARLRAIPEDIAEIKTALARLEQEDVQLATTLAQPWEHEARFVELSDELDAINAELKIAEQAESAHEGVTTSDTQLEQPSHSSEANAAPQTNTTIVLNAPDAVLMRVPVVIPDPAEPEQFASAFAALAALTGEEAAFDSVPIAVADVLAHDAEDDTAVHLKTSAAVSTQTEAVATAMEPRQSLRPATKPARGDAPIFGTPFKHSKGSARNVNPALACVVLTTEQLDFFDSTSQQIVVPVAPERTRAVQLTMAL